MEVDQHMASIEMPQIQPSYQEYNGHNGNHINNVETDTTSLDYYNIESKFVCTLSADLMPNPNSSYHPFRVFVVDNCSSFEHGLNYITSRQFLRFFNSLPYGFVIVLKCNESNFKNEANILIKLNSHYGTKKPLIVSFEANSVYKIFFKNHGENCRFSEVVGGQQLSPVTDFGTLIMNLESGDFGYFSGVFEDIWLNKCKQDPNKNENTIEKLMDIFAKRKDLLGIRFLHLFNPQLKPDVSLINGILDMDYNYMRDSDFDGFCAIFDYNIKDRTRSSTACQALDGFDCHLITNLTFKNDDNYLMLAVKKRNFEAVKFFIKCGINVNLKNSEQKKPADIAFEFGLYDILLQLLRANSMLPQLFYLPFNAPTELTTLVNLSTKLHQLIKDIKERCDNESADISKNDIELIDNIISKYPDLKYWYSMSNESAATKAICLKKFGTYNFLLHSGLFVGPYEEIELIKKNLSEDEQHKIREINANNAQPSSKNYLLILRLNSFLWQSNKFQKLHTNLIEDAFNILDNIPEIQPILEIVGAVKTFRIIFDFNKSHVETLDFTSNNKTSGVFHLRQSHIYIGAQDLLDETTKYSTIATLGHELSHFAMLLTYENLCNPYDKDDIVRQEMFQKVYKECEKECKMDNLILYVFSYKQLRRHAELIVRAPHMLIHYINNPVKLKSLKSIYPCLFEYYNKYVLNDVRDKIANVNQQFCENIKFEHAFWDKKRKRQKVIKYSVISALFVAMIGFFLMMLSSIEPCLNISNMKCKWNDLKESTKERLLSKNVTFNGNLVSLRELTRKDPQILRFLTDAQIRNIERIEINPQDLSLPFRYYDRKFAKYDEGYFYHAQSNCSYKHTSMYDHKTYKSIHGVRKIYQICDDSVTGKSTTCIHTANLKRSATTDIWVDYLDLQNFNFINYTSLTNWTSTNLTNFLIDIHNTARHENIMPDSLEFEIFIQKLESGEVALFIDHIDYIFMENEQVAESFLNALFGMSNNKSEIWITSRNWFGERIEKIIQTYDNSFVGRHKLLPLYCEDRDEFLTKSFEERRLTPNEVKLVSTRMYEIFNLTDTWRNWQFNTVDNICLITIIINHTIESIQANETDVNFYEVLEAYKDKILALKSNEPAGIYSDSPDAALTTVALRFVDLKYSDNFKGVDMKLLINDQLASINFLKKTNIFNVYGQNGSSWDLTDKRIAYELKRGVLKVIDGNISFLHLINLEYYVANYIKNKMWYKDYWNHDGNTFDQKLLLLFNIFKDPQTQFPIVQRCIIETVKDIQADKFYKRNYDENFKRKFIELYDDFINGTNIDVGEHLSKVFDDDEEMKEIIKERRIIQMKNYKIAIQIKKSKSARA
ncbi:hypothetical protein ACKWTF_015405 [Chironomus riparius]